MTEALASLTCVRWTILTFPGVEVFTLMCQKMEATRKQVAKRERRSSSCVSLQRCDRGNGSTTPNISTDLYTVSDLYIREVIFMFLCPNRDDTSGLPAVFVIRPTRRPLRLSVDHRRASSSSLVCKCHPVNNPAAAARTLTTGRFLLTGS